MVRVPNQEKTPRRTVRISDELWDAAAAKAETVGESVSDVVRRSLEQYVGTQASKPANIPTIHRDRTFTYKGEVYDILYQGRVDGYSIGWNDPDSLRTEHIADNMFTMREVREFLRRAVDEDWPTLRAEKQEWER